MTFEENNRAKMRRHREKRKDATIEVPFGVHTMVECPECGATFENGIFGCPRDEPSFGTCSKWDCDAFLKFVSDGTPPTVRSVEEAETEQQADLTQFVGGQA